MKIVHIGVYDRNIGDNIAISNLQRSLHTYIPNVEILGFDLHHLWNKKNDAYLNIPNVTVLNIKYENLVTNPEKILQPRILMSHVNVG